MRIWQTRFQVVQGFESLPAPNEIVFERQTGPEYHMDEARRPQVQAAQIVCTISGEGVFRQRDKLYTLTPGMAFIAPLCDPDISYYYPGKGAEPWDFLWFAFSGPQAVGIVNEINRRYGYIFRLPLDTGLIPHLESFRNQRNVFQIISPMAGAKIVQDVLAAFGETVEKDIATSSQAKLTRDAQNIITSNIDRTLDVAQIAERLHVTREHLTRVFRSQTGITPGQFAAAERMRIAVRLLINKTMSIKEIAERTGYDSASSFARAFKARFHVSPGNYTNLPKTDPAVREYLDAQSSNTEYFHPEENEPPVVNPPADPFRSMTQMSGDCSEAYQHCADLYTCNGSRQ